MVELTPYNEQFEKQFYELYKDNEKVSPLVTQLS